MSPLHQPFLFPVGRRKQLLCFRSFSPADIAQVRHKSLYICVMQHIGRGGFHPSPRAILMTAAKLSCIHQPGAGEQVLKRGYESSEIVGMNESTSIDGYDFLRSVSQDALEGRTGIENFARWCEERDGLLTVLDERTEQP